MRRNYKSTDSGVLPEGYAECEYIESTGTQWIYCPWRIGRTISEVEIKTEVYPIQENGYGAFVGTDVFSSLETYYTRLDGGRFGFFINQSTSVYNSGHSHSSWHNVYATLKNGVKTLEIDGIALSQPHTGTIQGNPSNLALCTYGNGRAAEIYCGRLKKTDVYIKANLGFINVEFLPCIRLSDNKPGMYDLCGSICPLTGTPFYINAGSGEFLYKLK